LKSQTKDNMIVLFEDYFMSCKKNHYTHEQLKNNSKNDSKKKSNDVVDRFLSILWRREVDWKLTFK
tara:strand:+ start:271 stop:468 length:198 start_codon:yes stop_codon:yes gene_type:complete